MTPFLGGIRSEDMKKTSFLISLFGASLFILGAGPKTDSSTSAQSATTQAQSPNPYISQTRQLTFVGPRSGEGYFSADGSLMI